jgi:hypothetical protein
LNVGKDRGMVRHLLGNELVVAWNLVFKGLSKEGIERL